MVKPYYRIIKRLPFLLSLMAFFTSQAQYKYEREVRITVDEASQDAVEWVSDFPFRHRIKWYKEFSLQDYSFEAKTKYKRKRISIEFSANESLVSHCTS